VVAISDVLGVKPSVVTRKTEQISRLCPCYGNLCLTKDKHCLLPPESGSDAEIAQNNSEFETAAP
jgi:hypothetical protein